MRILGAILAGGRSLRFGSDKARAPLDGVALIDHVVARLAQQVDEVVVCGREATALRALEDQPSLDLGPLGGLCAALDLAQSESFDAVVSVGCDLPRLPPDLVAALAGEGAAVVAGCPLVGWWPAGLAPRLLAHLLAGGDRSMRGFAGLVGAREVSLAGALVNVNTRDDLRNLAMTP